MVTNTTPNKSLYQITVGTEVGTWGPFINATTGILDNVLGGVATIALTNANVILSSAQYQCNFITFTGALSGSVTITFPPVGSFYTVQNLTSNTSAFQVTLITSVGGSQAIGCPWGQATQIFTDGTNVKFAALPHNVGGYWDHAGSSVPAWVSNCTIPPYLHCNGAAFSSATYPVLSTIMGGTTLPDSPGRLRMALDAGTGRVSSAVSGVPGNTLFGAGGDQSLQSHNHTANVTDPGHSHRTGSSLSILSQGVQGTTGGTGNFTGSATTFNSCSATTGITVTNSSFGSGQSQNMPPVYVGGITMVRAA